MKIPHRHCADLMLSVSLVLCSSFVHAKNIDSNCMSNPDFNSFAKDALADLQTIDPQITLTDVRNLLKSLGDCITLEVANLALDDYAESLQPTANSAPIITGIPVGKLAEGENYLFTPDASDADGDTLSFSIENKPTWASFDSLTGRFAGSPGYDDANTYSNIVISVSDSTDSTALPPFSIEVTNTNRPPSISGTPSVDVVVGESYSFIPTAADPDDDTLSFIVEQLPLWMSFDTTNGALTGVPNAEDEGVYTNIVVTVTDGVASVSLDAITIAVELPFVNSPPSISGIPDNSIQEGESYSFTPSADDADGDPLVFSIVNQPHWAIFDSHTGTLSGIPDYDDANIYSDIVINVTDGSENSALPPFSIEVINTNRAPSISGTPTGEVAVGERFSFTPSAVDPDGDTLIYSVEKLPEWMSFDNITGELSGVPSSGDEAIYTDIVVSVSDGLATASLAAITLTVSASVATTTTLSWAAPTMRSDGITEITPDEIAGYRIYIGSTIDNLQMLVDINDGTVTQYLIDGLESGIYFFAVTAYDTNDLESAFSEKVSKSI